MIEEDKNIKYYYCWDDEEEGELVYSVTTSHKPDTNKSPTVYNLRTPLKKSKNFTMSSEDDSAS